MDLSGRTTPRKSSSTSSKVLNPAGVAPDTHTLIGCLAFQSVHNWLGNTESQLGIGRLVSELNVCSFSWSRLDLLGNDGEDGVLVASSHHRSQRLLTLYGGADITGRGDPLAIDADDDVTFTQTSSVTQKDEFVCKLVSVKFP